jgi:ABC-type nitrate/sulfonate/bicarbonate transport system permease component
VTAAVAGDPTPSAAALPPETRRLPPWASSVFGVVGLIVAWQILGMTVFEQSRSMPPPTAVVSQAFQDGWSFYWPNIQTTVREAAVGWLWGNVLAIVIAVVFVQIPLVERALLKVAVASYCLPIVAIGPVLATLYSGDTPKVILAALSVFFTTLVGMLVGLRSADRTSLDLIRSFGGGSWVALTKVRLRACLPSLFAGLRIAAPAAVLGAMIGEYMGGENGLSVAMINSQQALMPERTWGIALAATAVAGIAYGITALVANLLTPWAPRLKR